MIFNCKRCNYQTTIKANLRSHLRIQNECIVINENIDREKLIEELYATKNKKYLCKYCNREYKSRQSKWSHEQKCNSNVSNKKTDKQIIINNNINNSVTNNIQNNNYNIIINNLRPFGKENYDFIDEEFIKNILVPKKDALLKLIKHVHFNNEHPENRNFLISNLRSDKAHIYNGEKFDANDKHTVLTQILNRNNRTLLKFLDDLNETNEYLTASFENEEEYNEYQRNRKNILKKIEELAYNERMQIENVKKYIDRLNNIKANEDLQKQIHLESL